MDGRTRLDEQLSVILDGGLGLAVFPKSILRSWGTLRPAKVRASALWRGFQIFSVYLVLFYAVPSAVAHFTLGAVPAASRPLLVLQIYGAFWAGWSTVTATLASDAVLRILRRDVLPRLSETTCDTIAEQLRLRYRPARLLLQSWIIAAVAATAAGLLIRDNDRLLEIVWWSCGWAILFATSAKVVATGTFYRIFAAYLADALGTRLWLDPVRSELVEAVARIGRVILLFWVGIAFSIALILPAGLDWSYAGGLRLHKETALFVALEVPVAGFFSIGVGVLVFLSAEAAIRSAVRTSQLRTLERLDGEAAAQIARIDQIGSDELKRVGEIRALHAALAGNGAYRSLFVGSLSVLLPFVPLFSLAITLLGKK